MVTSLGCARWRCRQEQGWSSPCGCRPAG